MGRAVGDAVGEITGANRQADAAESAASAQRDEAARQYNTNNRILTGAGDNLKSATVSGLAAMDQDIANQQRNLQRQQTLLEQLDPVIMEASQQALKLLRGEQSSTLAPVQDQRNLQRQKLLNQLREQLGPGAETSTAGIQALTRFDSETNNLLSGQQQQALGNLGNISAQFTSQRPDMYREIAGLSGLNQGKYSLAANQSNFDLQRVSALSGIGAQMINSAGAQYVGDQIKGQSQQALINNAISAGATMYGTRKT